MTRSIDSLRSQRWFAPDSMRAFAHRQRTQQTGRKREDFENRPVIAIINTWSDISTCHVHLRERANFVKEGIIRAGGYPLEMPAMSLGEVMVKPTTMLYRNFLAMETEELLRSHPVDGAILMGGCDKTTPGLLMGAFSMNIPVIFVPAGAALSGYFKGQKIGTGTHTRKFWDERRAGNLSDEDWELLESRMTRSHGTCNTMGTASTMTAIAEMLGMSLPDATTIPASDSAHPRMCSTAGERIVDMVWQDIKPSDIVTEKSFENGALNPDAWRTEPIGVEEILNSMMVNDPLTKFMFCSPSEGAVALIVCRADQAEKYTKKPIYIKAAALRSRRYGSFEVFAPSQALEHIAGPTVDTSKAAFEMAGVGPEDIDVAQLQDTEAGAEIMHMSENGFCEDGEQEQMLLNGENSGQ